MTTLGVFRDDYYNPASILPVAVNNASTQNGGTITAANMTGAQDVYTSFSGQTSAQSLTTDTAANIIAAIQSSLQTTAQNAFPPPSVVGYSYVWTVVNNNTSSGAITLTAGSGVTGTTTAGGAAFNTAIAVTGSAGCVAEFLVKVTSPTTVSITRLSSKSA